MTTSEPDVATRDSWDNLHPLPDRHVTIPLDIRLDARRAARLRQGFIPSVMEEKWFAYFADDVLYQHRSWSGICIDQVCFVPDGDGLRATHARVNRDPEQYGGTDDAADAARITGMVTSLADMPPGAKSKASDPMVDAIGQAMQPNYLGSPEVVRGLLLPFLDMVISVWRHRTDTSAPVVTPADQQAAASHLVNVFSGQDPAYVTMTWHCAEQLGQNLIAAMELDADYCADESLEFVLVEAVAAFSIKANAVLRSYVYAPDPNWRRDVEPKLIGLMRFFETALLGTNSVFFPGQTIGDLG